MVKFIVRSYVLIFKPYISAMALVIFFNLSKQTKIAKKKVLCNFSQMDQNFIRVYSVLILLIFEEDPVK